MYGMRFSFVHLLLVMSFFSHNIQSSDSANKSFMRGWCVACIMQAVVDSKRSWDQQAYQEWLAAMSLGIAQALALGIMESTNDPHVMGGAGSVALWTGIHMMFAQDFDHRRLQREHVRMTASYNHAVQELQRFLFPPAVVDEHAGRPDGEFDQP